MTKISADKVGGELDACVWSDNCFTKERYKLPLGGRSVTKLYMYKEEAYLLLIQKYEDINKDIYKHFQLCLKLQMEFNSPS